MVSDGWGQFAAKVCTNDSRDLMGEMRMLQAMSHPNLMPVQAWLTSTIPQVWSALLMPLGEGSLVMVCKDSPGTLEAWKLLRQVSGGLQFLHGKEILHMDLKPPNVILTIAKNF